MTVIRPNSISGVTSITAMANEINVFKHDGVLAGLQLNGVNHHTSSGVSTFHTLNVLGNVSVGGTLTYEDVTNIDSVGVITARSDIHVAGDIKNGTSLIDITQNGRIEIDIAGAEIVDINGNGVDVLGGLEITGDVKIPDSIIHVGDTNTKIRFPANDTFSVETAGSERLRIDSNGRVIIGHNAANGKLQVNNGTNSAVGDSTNPAFQIGGTTTYRLGIFTTSEQAIIANKNGDHGIAFHTKTASSGSFGEALRITSDGKVGINENAPENQLHIAGTTGNSAGGLLRLDATTGDNFIIFDNTGDNSEWVIGNDSGSNDEFRMYYNSGSGYGTEIVNIDGTTNNGKVTIDGGTTTLVQIRADSGGTAGLRLGGQAGSGTDQCTGFVEVHQDESHGGGMFYNGDGSPSFATGEASDYFSLYRFSSGTRHSVMRWFHSSNECNVQGNMLVDNGTSTIIRVRGDSAGTAGISCGGGDGQTQCTGYVEVTQDEIHGGGISYNGDGSPSFVGNETADRITFYRMNSGTRERVFHYAYNSNTVNFRGNIEAAGANANVENFKITHPHPSKKDTHNLIHSSIEGPQCDNIYRGKVDLVGGTATVNIDTVSNMTDGTFVLLNRDIQCFTTNETGWTNVKGSVTGNLLTIIAQDNTCTDTISWMVVGERQDDTLKSSEIETTDADGKLIVELLKEA